jgi:glycosyltransferase involved in cell wall biosynthesis
MKHALLVVAHPDDELLWFGGTILSHQDYDWTIACVTYNGQTARGRDFLQVCRELRAHGVLLSLEDAPAALLDEEALEHKLRQLAAQRQWHVVFTHNANGEYGHPHHRQVSRIVRKLWGRTVQSGFGAGDINAVVRLPAPIFLRKRALFDFYQSAGKHARMKLYPPYGLDFEPLVIPEDVTLPAVEKFKVPKTWKEMAGPGDLARRKGGRVYRVAVLADTRGWAHDVIAGHVIRNLPPEFEVDLLYLFSEDFTQRLPVTLNEADYDLIHLMSWRYWPVIKDWGLSREKLVTTIIGHRELDGDNRRRFLAVMEEFTCVSTVSQKLFGELAPCVPSLFLTPCGADTQAFYPVPREMDDGFAFGAVGRYYVEPNERDDIKGWKQILEPLAAELRPVRANYLQIDRAAQVPYEEMPHFYRQCHCYVCTSRSEGIPLPLLEAASSGLALLSTDVGVAPEIIDEQRNGMILPRDKQAFAQAIMELSSQRERCVAMGKHSRRIMLASRDWWLVAPRWAEFYQAAL